MGDGARSVRKGRRVASSMNDHRHVEAGDVVAECVRTQYDTHSETGLSTVLIDRRANQIQILQISQINYLHIMMLLSSRRRDVELLFWVKVEQICDWYVFHDRTCCGLLDGLMDRARLEVTVLTPSKTSLLKPTFG